MTIPLSYSFNIYFPLPLRIIHDSMILPGIVELSLGDNNFKDIIYEIEES